MPNRPHLDTRLGQRLRARRRQARWSMEALGDAIGVTYQQIQKYETGANRISAATLYEIAAALNAPIADFYADLPSAGGDPTLQDADRARFDALMASPGGPELLEAFVALPSRLRRPLLELARGAAGQQACTDDAKVLHLPTWG